MTEGVQTFHSRMPWRVTAVDALDQFRLHVRFVDGTEGIVDLAALIESPNAGVLSSLADPFVFAKVDVHLGAVSWPGGIDLAPDAMHADIHGQAK